MTDALLALRARFDEVDRLIIANIAARLRLADEAANIKAAMGVPVVDEAREAQANARRSQQAQALGVNDALVHDVFALLVQASRQRQVTTRGQNAAPSD